ncbi:MAG: ABC transporter permease [Verrucomicrobiota bacterium]|jgi:NitT/TauT family transport system permease protein|nr:MAG: ABC transporter permease [Opitutales bacterium]
MKLPRFVIPTLVAVTFLGGWEWFVRVGHVNDVLVPAPSQILHWFWDSLLNGELLSATWVTMRRLIIGFAIGAALGVPLGALCARVRWIRDTLGVLALGLQTLPSVCWVPLALLWFGQEESALLFVVVMGTIWAVVIAVQESVLNVQPLYLRAAMTMGSKGWHLWLRVILPAALPGVLSGMKQGWAFAWRSLMAAEIFVVILTGFGLGSLLHAGRELLRMDQVMGVMTVVVLVGLLADLIFFAPLERWLRRSRGL